MVLGCRAPPDAHLFSWTDSAGIVRPLTRDASLGCLDRILGRLGFGTAFGHSARIGGASHYLAQGISPELVRIAGRWKSLAYELYVRSFELVVARQFADRVDFRPLPRPVGV